jgi:hypothetical protein
MQMKLWKCINNIQIVDYDACYDNIVFRGICIVERKEIIKLEHTMAKLVDLA